jgi:hypothetical protein
MHSLSKVNRMHQFSTSHRLFAGEDSLVQAKKQLLDNLLSEGNSIMNGMEREEVARKLLELTSSSSLLSQRSSLRGPTNEAYSSLLSCNLQSTMDHPIEPLCDPECFSSQASETFQHVGSIDEMEFQTNNPPFHHWRPSIGRHVKCMDDMTPIRQVSDPEDEAWALNLEMMFCQKSERSWCTTYSTVPNWAKIVSCLS